MKNLIVTLVLLFMQFICYYANAQYYIKNISCYNTDMLHVEHNDFGAEYVIYEITHPEANYWQVQMDVATNCGGGKMAIQDDINEEIIHWFGSKGDIKGFSHVLNGRIVKTNGAAPWTFLSPYLTPENSWMYNEQDMVRYTVRTRKNKVWIILYLDPAVIQVLNVKFKCNQIETWSLPQDIGPYNINDRRINTDFNLPKYMNK